MKPKALAIPKESSMPILSLICSFLMFLTFFFYFQSINGEVQGGITTPIAAFHNDLCILFFNILSSSIPIVLFITTICFAKRDIGKVAIATAIMPITYLLYEIYSKCNGYVDFILNDWFRVGMSIIIFVLCFFTFNKPVIKSKWPLILVCCIGIITAILFTIFRLHPFAIHFSSQVLIGEKEYSNPTLIYQSALVQFCSYLCSILFLAIPLTPGGEYKHKNSRKFFVMKHYDEIHAINLAHRGKK